MRTTMFKRPLLAVLVTVALGAVSAVRDTPALVDAHTAYYNEQFDRSLVQYEKLAAHGDAIAAERAGFMLLQGEAMYGKRVKRDVAKAQGLLLQAAKAGRPGAEFMLNMMERTE